jgi:hypothetical protein
MSGEPLGASRFAQEPVPDGPVIELSNEFASVVVRKVRTRNGERLLISAPKRDIGILLCPLELESLTWQTPETFSAFLADPFGPDADDD